MNTVANSIGLRRGRPEGVLGRLMRAYAERASRPLQNVERHVMRIAPAGGGGMQSYGFLFGTGVVYGFLAEYYKGGEATPSAEQHQEGHLHRINLLTKEGPSSIRKTCGTAAQIWELADSRQHMEPVPPV